MCRFVTTGKPRQILVLLLSMRTFIYAKNEPLDGFLLPVVPIWGCVWFRWGFDWKSGRPCAACIGWKGVHEGSISWHCHRSRQDPNMICPMSVPYSYRIGGFNFDPSYHSMALFMSTMYRQRSEEDQFVRKSAIRGWVLMIRSDMSKKVLCTCLIIMHKLFKTRNQGMSSDSDSTTTWSLSLVHAVLKQSCKIICIEVCCPPLDIVQIYATTARRPPRLNSWWKRDTIRTPRWYVFVEGC